jgi:hypothetical protein
MTPFYRGVSDLGCGRGHDRRRGQISWSLTPRSPRWRCDDRGDGERSATYADRVLGTRSLHRTSTCSGRRKCVRADWLESNRARFVSREGEHPARSPVPLPVPPPCSPSLATLSGRRSGPLPGTSEPEPRDVGLRFRIQERDKAAQPNRQGPRPPPLGGTLLAGNGYALRASARSSCSKADAMRSAWDFVRPKVSASSRHRATAAPTSAAMARAFLAANPK